MKMAARAATLMPFLIRGILPATPRRGRRGRLDVETGCRRVQRRADEARAVRHHSARPQGTGLSQITLTLVFQNCIALSQPMRVESGIRDDKTISCPLYFSWPLTVAPTFCRGTTDRGPFCLLLTNALKCTRAHRTSRERDGLERTAREKSLDQIALVGPHRRGRIGPLIELLSATPLAFSSATHAALFP
jgi:hypothetical protein